ncbi:MAG: hypothetical protein EP329_28265 [Deltaproteobacteria bacterium]|nr:MAG: hypothetical protein EP329_28265 [Deltaproteobacteria bacterium]
MPRTLLFLASLLAPLALTTAAASAQTPRVAIAPIADEVGLDPRALSDMVIGLRGAALEEDIDVLDLSAEAASGAGCDLICLGELADQLGAGYLLVGLAGRSEAGGLEVALELRRVTRGDANEIVDTLVASAPDTPTLVVGTERAGRKLLSGLRLPAAPVRTTVRRPVRVQPRGDVYHPAVVQWDERSAGLALALEILFPGAGLGYAGDWASVGLEYLGIFTGFVLIISSVSSVDEDGGHVDGMGMGLGLTLMFGSRIYGIVRAPAAADEYNTDARRAWEGRQVSAELRRMRLPAPEIGLAAPTYTALSLPPLSF